MRQLEHLAVGGERDRGIVECLADLGERYDRDRSFPHESLALLRSQGLHRRFSDPLCGGLAYASPRARNLGLLDALRLAGRGDLSVGRLFEGHVNALALIERNGSQQQLDWLRHALDAGAWFGVWATEPPPGVALRATGEGLSLTGAKSFASGAGALQYAIITARGNEGVRMVVVPADDGTRADLSGWQVRGMRASISGTYEFSGMRVAADQILGKVGDYESEPGFTAGGWRFCAVQLGGIEGLLAATREAMSQKARGDAVQRARFADAVVVTRSAGFWVREAAIREAEARADAAAFVCLVRGIVERAAFDVMEAAARIVGTASAFEGTRIDKITRDLSLYLRQGAPDLARDRAAQALLDHDLWHDGERLW
jgi:alkylation response protein AidB-like acyl-CoA dehydrogenase